MSMRVTQRSIVYGSTANLQDSLARSQRVQEKLTSGKEIARPSDNPTDVHTALDYRASIRRADQLKRNADDGLAMLGTADTALTDTSNLIKRARDLAVQGANATLNVRDREAIALEIDQLHQQAISLANTAYQGRPLFSGTAAPAAGGDTAYTATGAYNGNSGAVMRTVAPGESVQVNLIGTDVFGPSGNDLFTTLATLANDLRTSPASVGTADLSAIDTAFTRVTTALASVGARVNRVESIRTQTETTQTQQADRLNAIEAIDIPKTIMELQLQQTAYQAALAATAKVIQPSLMDFLR